MAEIRRRWGSIVAMRSLVVLLAVTTSLAACGGESTSIDSGFETFFEAKVEPEFDRTLAGMEDLERSDMCELLGAEPSCDVDSEAYIEVVRERLTWGATLEEAEQLCAATADDLKAEVIRLLETDAVASPVRPDFGRIVSGRDTVEEHRPELRFRLMTLATGCPDRLGDVASEAHERRYVDHAEQFRTDD